MAAAIMEWGGDQDNAPQMDGGNLPRFKAKKGESYRMSFCWWPIENGTLNMSAKKPRFLGGKRAFVPNHGYILSKGPEYNALLPDAKLAIGTFIILWPLNKNGDVDTVRVNAGDYEILAWIFAENRYKVLETQWREWGPGQHDMTALCEDEQFQKMTFSPCKNSILRQLVESVTDHHKAIVQNIVDRVQHLASKLPNEVGRDMPIDELRIKMGKASASGPSAAGTGVSSQVNDLMTDDQLDGILV